MIDTILMDLDGTLLPFEQRDFIEQYFKRLCAQLAPFGIAPEAAVKAVWSGTKAMMKNDGAVWNRDRFWDAFAELLGDGVRDSEDTLDAFYQGDFDQIKTVLQGTTCAKELVDTLKAKGYTVVLATNPLFPAVAQHTRLSWAGLTPQDFAHITHYQNSHFCKPNVRYYEEILDTIGKTPAQCMMIGNSVSEDMIAQTLGMEVYFVNRFVENPDNLPTDGYAQGTLEDFLAVAKALPCVNEG